MNRVLKVALCCALLAGMAALGLPIGQLLMSPARAAESVSYVERSWDEATKQVVSTTKTITDYVVLNSEMIDSDGEIWINFNHNQQDVPEWVVVRDDLTIPSKMVCKYDVRLVLCDGATLTVNSGVVCDAGNDTTSRLTIYGQANDTGNVNSYTFIDPDAKPQKEEKPVELPFLPVD